MLTTDRLVKVLKLKLFTGEKGLNKTIKNIDISKIRTTGIGLKISKQIVDLHQGSISFASVQNEFFESIISLPIFNITN